MQGSNEAVTELARARRFATDVLAVANQQRGHWACSESLLPASKAEIGQLLEMAIRQSKRRDELLESAILELMLFVPEAEAQIVESYRQSVLLGSNLTDQDEAKAVIERLRDDRTGLITYMWGGPRLGVSNAIGKEPIAAGEAMNSLKRVKSYQRIQTFGFYGMLATPFLVLAAIFALLRNLSRRLRSVPKSGRGK